MNKILTFIIMFYCAFTIIHFTQGSDFSFYTYVQSLDTLNQLERPKLSTIEFRTFEELSETPVRYYFDTEKVNWSNSFYDLGTGDYYLVFGDKRYNFVNDKLESENNGIDFVIIYYDEFEFAQMPDEARALMKSENLEYEGFEWLGYKLKILFRWLFQPMQIIIDFLKYIVSCLGYFINVLTIVGGGLLV